MTDRQIDPLTGMCRCATCTSVEAALDADLAAHRPACAACGDWLLVPPRLFDTTGQPICEACRCPCCGKAPDCDCDIDDVDSYDRETGWTTQTGCFTHRRSV